MRIRTADPLLAKQMLYQLSYAPKKWSPARFACQPLGGRAGEIQKAKLYVAPPSRRRARTDPVRTPVQVSSIELGRLRLSPPARTIAMLPRTRPGALGVDLSALTGATAREPW